MFDYIQDLTERYISQSNVPAISPMVALAEASWPADAHHGSVPHHTRPYARSIREPVIAMDPDDRQPAERGLSWWALLLGLAFGIAAALVYTWEIDPVIERNTAPWQLSEADREDYVIAVALSYTANQDLALAFDRLRALRPSQDVWSLVADIACNRIKTGQVVTNNDIRVIRAGGALPPARRQRVRGRTVSHAGAGDAQRAGRVRHAITDAAAAAHQDAHAAAANGHSADGYYHPDAHAAFRRIRALAARVVLQPGGERGD